MQSRYLAPWLVARPVPPTSLDRISPVEALRAWDWPKSMKEAIQSFEFVKRLPDGVSHCDVLSALVNGITAATWGLMGTEMALWYDSILRNSCPYILRGAGVVPGDYNAIEG